MKYFVSSLGSNFIIYYSSIFYNISHGTKCMWLSVNTSCMVIGQNTCLIELLSREIFALLWRLAMLLLAVSQKWVRISSKRFLMFITAIFAMTSIIRWSILISSISWDFGNTFFSRIQGSSSRYGISVNILVAQCLYTQLSYIVNISLDQDVVPVSLKFSRVVPVYKIGAGELVANHRSISVLLISPKFSRRPCLVVSNHSSLNTFHLIIISLVFFPGTTHVILHFTNKIMEAYGANNFPYFILWLSHRKKGEKTSEFGHGKTMDPHHAGDLHLPRLQGFPPEYSNLFWYLVFWIQKNMDQH